MRSKTILKEKSFSECAQLIKESWKVNHNNNLLYVGLEHIEQQTLQFLGKGQSSQVTSQKFKFKNGDILFGKLRPYFRKVVRPNFDGICSTDIFVVRAKPGTDQSFLYYWMASQEFIDYASRGSEGTKMPRAKWDFLSRYSKKIPNLDQQKRIGKTLSHLDNKIHLIKNINEILEKISQTIFKSWFINFDGQTEFVDSEFGEIPKGWKFSTIGKETNNFDSKRIPLSSRERLNRKGSFPYYGAAEIIDYIDDYIFDGNYVLIAEDGTVINKDGKPYVQYVLGKFWANNHVHVLKGKNHISTEFLYLFFKQLNILSCITGAVQLKINQTNLNSIPIILPDKEILKKFQELVIPLFRNKIINELAINKLVNTRDSFLPKLLSGEIRV